MNSDRVWRVAIPVFAIGIAVGLLIDYLRGYL